MNLRLVVQTEGTYKGKVLDIKLAEFIIGRDHQCHLRPASPFVSKRHCALFNRDGKAFIQDLNSTNGTVLNDQLVKGEVELAHGDVLKVGPLGFGARKKGRASAPPESSYCAAMEETLNLNGDSL